MSSDDDVYDESASALNLDLLRKDCAFWGASVTNYLAAA